MKIFSYSHDKIMVSRLKNNEQVFVDQLVMIKQTKDFNDLWWGELNAKITNLHIIIFCQMSEESF